MFRPTKNLAWALILGLMPFTITSCDDDDDDPMMTNTIADVASSDARFSSLVAALDRAGLVPTVSGTDEYTVFAPTNDAFATFLMDNGFATLEDVPVDLLTNVLLNHVVGGEVRSTDLTNGYIKTAATEATTMNTLRALVDLTGGVFINGSTEVTEADIDADNGVIHAVNEVIALPTVVNLAIDNSGLFSTLVAALTRADLTADFVGILTGDGPFTVFAPTNDAFQALLDSDPTWTVLADIPVATLEAVLSYHVVAGANVLSSTLTDGQVVGTFGGSDLTINIAGADVSITTSSAGSSNIVATDVQGINGVVHVIDAVLIP